MELFLKIVIGAGMAVFLFIILKELFTCIAYEEWKKLYIPVSQELGEALERLTYLNSLPNPSQYDLAMLKVYYYKVKELAEKSNRLWLQNPRHPGRPAGYNLDKNATSN